MTHTGNDHKVGSGSVTAMFNPEIVKCSGAYEAEDG